MPRLPTAPRTNHGQPTAQMKGEGDHTLLWLLAEARPEAMAELSFLPTIGHTSVSSSTVPWKPRAQNWMTDIAATAF